MSDIQQEARTLAMLQALRSAIGAQVELTRPGNLRDRVNGHYHDLYEDTGATGFEIRSGNGREKIGTYGFNKRKGQPARTESRWQVTDRRALAEWARSSEDYRRWLEQINDDALWELTRQYFEDTGEMPDGAEMVEVTVPATPDTIRPNGTLRVSRQMVTTARELLAGGGLAGLLGGGR